MRMFAICYDKGEYYLIASCTQSDSTIDCSIDGKVSIEIFDTLIFQTIQDNILLNKSIKFPKGITNITATDLIIGDSTELESVRNMSISKLMNFVNKRVGTEYAFYLFQFNILNNKLLEFGYYITSENSNTKYLEILQKGLTEEISTLELFLDAKSKIDEYQSLFTSFKKYYDLINEEDDIENIKKYFNEFMNEWE